MRWLLILWLLWPVAAVAQSSTVLPSELELGVTIDDDIGTPFPREMVLITIRGIYRRHITLEKLVQPDLDGFSWSQLGPDFWKEERINGEKVKVFTRRMALYPDREGTLTIGAFKHTLTLTDEGDDWFEHQIQSEPLTLMVVTAPKTDRWWFPVRSLKISDQWSNAPDQLKPGEGVLRVVRLEALGVTPEMIPPMPVLNSPSAMIFPHPEKRLVELTPHGPVTYAFWRWTIRPTNDTSTIVEPLTFSYFDTVNRVAREVTISAQRVAYGDVTGDAVPDTLANIGPSVRLPGWGAAFVGLVVMMAGVTMGVWGRQIVGTEALSRFALFDPLARQLRRAARQGESRQVRRISAAMLQRDGATEARRNMLDRLDKAIFSPETPNFDLRGFVMDFTRKGPKNAQNIVKF
jgi:hypothetical protein